VAATATDDAEVAQPSGLDAVRQVFAMDGSARGIARTMAIKGVAAEPGVVTLEGAPTEDHYSPLGTVHGGYAATLLDAAIGLALQTALPAGTGYATVDLKVTYVRSMTQDSGPVVATGKIIHCGKRMAASEATLVDRDGRLCAHATATYTIFR
jgi:uncharacterized protein (TIGR00369 family)